MPASVQTYVAKYGIEKPYTTPKKKETVLKPQAQEKEASPTYVSDEIQAFRKELDALAKKHLGAVPENKPTNTSSVNTGSEPDKIDSSDHDIFDDEVMPELEIFHEPNEGIFTEASYDEEGVVTKFTNLPTKVDVTPVPTLWIHNIHPQSQILGDPKLAVQTRRKVHQQLGAHVLISFMQK